MRNIRDMEGIKVGGVNLNNIRYADDTVLVADTPEKLQALLNVVKRESERMGLNINIKKTEVMVASKKIDPPNCNLYIDNTRIKQVDRFVYLGSTLSQDARSKGEIERRILIAKNAFSSMKNLLTNNRISMTTRVRALKTYVWSTLMYGSESWTLNREMKSKLKAVEMWFYRRMLRVSWRDRVTNEEILVRVGQCRSLLGEIRKRQMDFLGHVLRREKIEHLCLTGMFEGRRARGRPRVKYLDTIIEDMGGGMTANEMVQLARDRERWKGLTAHVCDMALR